MAPSSDRLREFTTVVREGSISRAARVLELPRATLSRRMNGLERDLGVRLLHRKSRPLQLTPAGEELLGRASRIVEDTHAAWEAVKMLDGVPRGLLRISLPPNVPAIHRYIVGFIKGYPEVELNVAVDSRHVDFAAAGVDLAIRVGEIKDTSLVVRRIWRSAIVAVASPQFLSRHGPPRSTEELREMSCLTTFDGEGIHAPRWPLRGGGTLSVSSQFACGDIALLKHALLEGLGIGLFAEDLIAEPKYSKRF